MYEIELFIKDNVKELGVWYKKDRLYARFIWSEYCKKHCSERMFRACIYELIVTDRLRCFIASAQGYKFAESTLEMQIYLKSVHHRAMEILKRLSALKSQAELDFGKQIEIEL